MTKFKLIVCVQQNTLQRKVKDRTGFEERYNTENQLPLRTPQDSEPLQSEDGKAPKREVSEGSEGALDGTESPNSDTINVRGLLTPFFSPKSGASALSNEIPTHPSFAKMKAAQFPVFTRLGTTAGPC